MPDITVQIPTSSVKAALREHRFRLTLVGIATSRVRLKLGFFIAFLGFRLAGIHTAEIESHES